jgi:hypothetical protein
MLSDESSSSSENILDDDDDSDFERELSFAQNELYTSV